MVCGGLGYFLVNFHRFSLGVISLDLAGEFDLGPVGLGLLGSVSFYTYALMQVPCGLITDRFHPRVILTVSCILTAAATFWFSSAREFAGLVSSRTLLGFAVAFIYLPSLAVIRESFDEKIFGTMAGALLAMGQLGAVFTSVPLQLAANNLGWRGTFRIVTYLTIVLCILVFFPIHVKRQKEKAAVHSVLQSSKETFKKPGFWSIVVLFLLVFGSRISFQGLWGARFFDVILNGRGEKAAFLMAISIGCVFGSMLLGFLADRFGYIRIFRITCFSIAIGWFVLAVFGHSAGIRTLYVTSFLFGVAVSGSYAIATGMIRFYSSEDNMGFLVGISGSAAFFGSAFFTQMTGLFFSRYGAEDVPGFRILFLSFCVISVLCTLLVLRTNRDLETKAGATKHDICHKK